MKMNITVDLQDIFDNQNEQAYHDGADNNSGGTGYDLSEVIKGEITNSIMNKVSKDCIDAVMKKANEKIDKALELAIDKAIGGIEQKSLDYAENWLNGDNIILTDRYGNETANTNIREVVEGAYTDTLTKRVDESGKFTTSSYGKATKLVDFIATKHVKECVESRMPDMSRKLDKAIQVAIDEHSTKLVTAKIAKVLATTP